MREYVRGALDMCGFAYEIARFVPITLALLPYAIYHSVKADHLGARQWSRAP